MLKNYRQVQEGNIDIRYVEGDEIHARDTMVALREASCLLDQYFGLVSPFSNLRAILVPTRSEYERLVVNLLGVNIEIPSNPGRLAQPQRTDLVFLSPSAYEEHSTYTYYRDEYMRLVFHEAVHVYEELLSPNIEESPLWWSEGLAVYLSGQWKQEDQFRFRSPVAKGVAEATIPSFASVARERGLGYDWGWTVVMYIEDVQGKDMVISTVNNCSDGNIALAIGEPQLEQKWRQWLQGRGRQLIGI